MWNWPVHRDIVKEYTWNMQQKGTLRFKYRLLLHCNIHRTNIAGTKGY